MSGNRGLNDHTIAWTIECAGGEGQIEGRITCNAPEGSWCRMGCPANCEEWGEEHEHDLADTGECILLPWIENSGERVEFFYVGDRMPLREGPVKLKYIDEGVEWQYLFLDDSVLASAVIS